MQRYFFDIEDIENRRDDVGEELEGLSAARIVAVKLSAELLHSFPDRFWSVGRWSVSCRDESGSILFVLRFWAENGADVHDVTM